MKLLNKTGLALTALLCVAPLIAMNKQTPQKAQQTSSPSSPTYWEQAGFPYDPSTPPTALHHTNQQSSSPEFPRTLYSPQPRQRVLIQSPAHSPASPASFMVASANSSLAYSSPSWSLSSIGSHVSTPSSSSFNAMPYAQGRALRFSQPVVGKYLAIPTAQQQIAATQAEAELENARRMQALNYIIAEGRRRAEAQRRGWNNWMFN
jgi:hypothetical protein